MEDKYETKEIKGAETKMSFKTPAVKKPILVHEPEEDLVIWEARGPKFKFKNNGNIHSYDSKEKAKEGLALFK
jgi:hypothetical protein